MSINELSIKAFFYVKQRVFESVTVIIKTLSLIHWSKIHKFCINRIESKQNY